MLRISGTNPHSFYDMMNNKQKQELAKLNPFQSVVKYFSVDDEILVGIKNDFTIPNSIMKVLEKHHYKLHTIDKKAFGGRAIDLHLINPISGRYMTGSSSGTAINVFLSINDIGIGTDGGGSVLAPAISLNLFSFISPLLCQEEMIKHQKISTDGIIFSPSIGFMCRNLELLKNTICYFIALPKANPNPNVLIDESDNTNYPFKCIKTTFETSGERRDLLKFLADRLPKCDFILVKEGPIDVDGFGDTVFGHFDCNTKTIQQKANKKFVKVINMANASAMCIPTNDFATSYIGICESKKDKIASMINCLSKLKIGQDELIERFFRNHDTWFMKGYEE